MDAGYAVLFTVVTVIAMIVATLFFFNQQEQQEQQQSTRSKAATPPPAAAPPPPAPSQPMESVGVLQVNPSAEDAGPIFLSVMPSSKDDLWKVWFDQPSQLKGMTQEQFEDSMKVLGTLNTMADFWDRFSNLMHEKLPTKSNVRVFQANVRPVWEDPVNYTGGKWIIVLPKQKSGGVFNEILAGMVGGKLPCEVSGLVLSKKVREDLVAIWTPSGLPVSSLEALRDAIAALLETHLGIKPEISFKPHDKNNKLRVEGCGEKPKKAERADQEDGEAAAPAPAHRPNSRPGFSGVKPPRNRPAADGTGQGPPPVVENAWGARQGPPPVVENAWGDRASQQRAEKTRTGSGRDRDTRTGSGGSGGSGRDRDTRTGSGRERPPSPPEEPAEAPVEPDGWEVVRTKGKKEKGPGRKKTL